MAETRNPAAAEAAQAEKKPEQKPAGKAENKPEARGQNQAPQLKPDHSPSEARIKSFEQTIEPSGAVKIRKEYFEHVPEQPSVSSAAEHTMKGSAKVEVGGVAVEAEGSTEAAGDKAKTKPATEVAKPESHAPEKKEEEKKSESPGEETVKKVQHSPETPHNVKEGLADEKNAKAAAEAVNNKSTFGRKVKDFAVGFVAGAAARAGIRFLAKRALDFGSVGTGAIAGGVVGGGMEFYKSFRSESKRLYDLKTYTDALSGYDSMTDLEKVTAIIGLEEKLKQRFTKPEITKKTWKSSLKARVMNPTLNPEELARFHAMHLDLRTRLEKLREHSSVQDQDKAKVDMMIDYRNGTEKKESKRSWGEFFSRNTPEKKAKREAEKAEKAKKLEEESKLRSKTDADKLKKEQKPEVKALLEQFYRERGLNRNWRKISWETTKGTVIGAAGGALGSYVFEHFINPQLGHYQTPDMHSGDETAWHLPGGGDHGSLDHGPLSGGGGGHGGFGPGGGHELAGAHGADVAVNTPSMEDTQTLHKTVWDTCKQYMVDHGVANPSNHDINEAMLRICKENGIEISGHHNVADFANFHHEHFEKLIDVKLQNGLKLHGFDKLGDLIKHGGGHALGVQEIVAHTHVAGETAARDWLAAHGAEEIAKQQDHLNTMGWLIYGGEALGALVGVGYAARRYMKKGNEVISMDLGKIKHKKETGPVLPPTELVGTPEEIKTASLERRLELVNMVKVEALGRISKAAEYLEGDDADLEAYNEAILLVGAVYNKQQLEHLGHGASPEDQAKILKAWQEMGQELTQAASPVVAKAQEFKRQEAEAAGSASEQAVDDDGDDDNNPGGAKKPKKNEAGAEHQKGKGWTESHLEGRKNVHGALKKGEEALKQKLPAKAEEHLIEAAVVISSLDALVKTLKPKDRKIPRRQVEGLQQEADRLRDKINEYLAGQTGLDAEDGAVKQTNQEQGKNSVKKDYSKNPDYGVEQWKVAYYEKAIDLDLLGVVAPVPFNELTPKRQEALDRFVLLMQEGGNSIFQNLYKSRTTIYQKGLERALVDLKGGNRETLNKFCLRVLGDGKHLGEPGEAAQILGCIRDLNSQAGGIVNQAFSEFRQKNKLNKLNKK